eukprot:m.256517 g.256517  ORF g.256517 m.256517 type:complete len:279 (+) comp20192_c0_seq1:51-887(+)
MAVAQEDALLSADVTEDAEFIEEQREWPTVFVDLDGTLCPTEMHHVVYNFIRMLPSRRQRFFKLLVFVPSLAIAGIANAISESLCIEVLAWLALRGVSVHDAEHAATKLARVLKRLARPALLECLERHQTLGRQIAIISGNAQPLIAPFCALLGARCYSSPCVIRDGHYTGRIDGVPLVGVRKTFVLRGLLSSHQPGPPPYHHVFGYGNSMNDQAFLALVQHPHAVTPDNRLLAHSRAHMWSEAFHVVTESPTVVRWHRRSGLTIMFLLFSLQFGYRT